MATNNTETNQKSDNTGPPLMRNDLPYKDWKFNTLVWWDSTTMAVERQGPKVFLALTAKAQQTVRAILSREEMKTAGGLKLILDALDTLYLKDDLSTSFAAYEDFTSYRRAADTSIQDFLYDHGRQVPHQCHDRLTLVVSLP